METYSAFITYLRQKMISAEPSADELISLLDKQLLTLKTYQNRANLLNEIEKLRKASNMDVHYKGMIQDFFNYTKFKQEDEKDPTEIKKDWSGLYNELIGKYIKDVNLNDFNEVMTFHRLPSYRAGRIIWTGNRYEGFAFSKRLGFNKLPDFKKCFVPENGKDFRQNDNTPIKFSFEKLLDKYNKS